MKNKNKIELNKLYKYADLCALFCEPIKKDASKLAQIKTWEQYFKIEKAPKANYIFVEKYNKKKPKITRGKNPNSHHNQSSEYNIFLEPLMLNYLKNQHKKKIIRTNSQLCCDVGFFSNSNKWGTIKASSKELSIEIETVKDFYIKLNSMKQTPIFTVLNKLQNMGYVKFKTGYAINFNGSLKTRMATSKEEKLIKELEDKVLKEMKIKCKSEFIYRHTLRDSYYEELNKLIKENINNVYSVLQSIEIKILDAINNIEIEKDVEDIRKQLNEVVVSKLVNYFICKKTETQTKLDELISESDEEHKKQINDCWGEPPLQKTVELNVWEQHRLSDNYLIDINKLISKFIKIS